MNHFCFTGCKVTTVVIIRYFQWILLVLFDCFENLSKFLELFYVSDVYLSIVYILTELCRIIL